MPDQPDPIGRIQEMGFQHQTNPAIAHNLAPKCRLPSTTTSRTSMNVEGGRMESTAEISQLRQPLRPGFGAGTNGGEITIYPIYPIYIYIYIWLVYPINEFIIQSYMGHTPVVCMIPLDISGEGLGALIL